MIFWKPAYLRLMAAGLLTIAVSAQASQARTISYNTAAGGATSGGAVSAIADFTIGNGTITSLLINVSGVFAITSIPAVPESASLIMAVIGLICGLVIVLRRRRDV